MVEDRSAASPSLVDRLRDVDEQNALVVRRRAADRIEELEAELVEQRSFLLSEVHRAEDERDAERHRAVAAETRLIRGRHAEARVHWLEAENKRLWRLLEKVVERG